MFRKIKCLFYEKWNIKRYETEKKEKYINKEGKCTFHNKASDKADSLAKEIRLNFIFTGFISLILKI